MTKLENLISELCPHGVQYSSIGHLCAISTGGDVPKTCYSKNKTPEFEIPIYSNGIAENALYGYTNIAKIKKPCVTVSARGTIGYCQVRETPFYPVIRLICLIPDEEILSVHFLKYAVDMIKFQVPTTGIPQLTAPMVAKYRIPLPPLEVQQEIVRVLDSFTELTAELNKKLEEEIIARRKQYEYYRDKLLTFKESVI